MSAAAITISPAQLADLEAIAASLEEQGEAQRDEIRRAQGIGGFLRGKMADVAVLLAAARGHMEDTGGGRSPEVVEAALEEASSAISAAFAALREAVLISEMRVDLDGRDDVTVLAEARERLRASGRRR